MQPERKLHFVKTKKKKVSVSESRFYRTPLNASLKHLVRLEVTLAA